MKFFDCNAAFGPYRTQVFRFSRTADELLEEMDFSNIDRALVYHTTMRFDHPLVGNERVIAESAGRPRLLPTWSLLPSQTGEQPPIDELLGAMQRHNVRAPAAVSRRPPLFLRRHHVGRPTRPLHGAADSPLRTGQPR